MPKFPDLFSICYKTTITGKKKKFFFAVNQHQKFKWFEVLIESKKKLFFASVLL